MSEVKLPTNVEALYTANGDLKAKPVLPPEELDTSGSAVEVNMTTYYLTNIALSAATVGLGAATAYLWRKVRKQDEHMEAVREYLSRLINETNCGKEAYVTFLVDEDLEETVNWANEREPVDEDDLAEKIDQ